ncbi:MAG: Ku protein [Nitrospiraceae bacterium]|nr:MAG: Ku protein [Nitrospiraceae bacterium]
MAGRTLWKGYIQFSDFNVPVKLHTAVHQERMQFHLLHKHDRVKLHQQMICAHEKIPVPLEEQSKGFELEDRKYILVDPEELEQTKPDNGRMIKVHEFVRTEQIDPVFLERMYYLEPDKTLNGYNALVSALKETGTAGVCTWTMRRRSCFGSLQINGKVLCLNTLRYADEVIPAKSLGLEKASLSEKELKIARELINQLSAPFQPEKFQNEHQKKLQDLIDKKARGEKIAVLRPRRLKPTAPDKLLQALNASLEKVA